MTKLVRTSAINGMPRHKPWHPRGAVDETLSLVSSLFARCGVADVESIRLLTFVRIFLL